MARFALHLPFPLIPDRSRLRDTAAARSGGNCCALLALLHANFCCTLALRCIREGSAYPFITHLCVMQHCYLESMLIHLCSESTPWICIFSFVKHTQEPLLSFPLRATTLVSIQTNRSWEYSVSTGQKTCQVLCATAFLARHKTL